MTLFPAEATQRGIARELYAHARDLPLISPHGHVDPALLAEDEPFGDPARLFVVPDHYVTRMLASQGIPPARLGVPSIDGSPVETDGRAVWRLLAENWHLFRGTPSRLWTEKVFAEVFGIGKRFSAATADEIYDQLSARLAEPDYRPRALFTRFNIEVLATTESPIDDLGVHAKLAADGWGGPGGRVITTFRPDNLVDMEWDGWADRVAALGALTGQDVGTYPGFLTALRARRELFVAAGATCSDHGHPTAATLDLDDAEAAVLYRKGLGGAADARDAEAFRAHMLVEFARMSIDDGLVMQLHPGSVRNHNQALYARHGRDVGGDIPSATEYVRALRPLLDRYGHDPRLRIVLYTLDETAFTRELAPLAGGYAALYLGAPWWFLDSPEGLRRFREAVTETAGFYNTAGFVDDTRAFCSIPARHDVARRVDAGFLARLVAEGRLPLDEAAETIADLAYHLPKRVYRLDRAA
ncbi:glucuronate isomerase [Actinoplanes sp. SE50]|uniref:glucuronate isomerase n=1 Tax=unclassified Actinoplanes TaxID=2626549 RepID=UPI00023EBDA8|nr:MULTISPECIES: glucuronate isomerase [unclassified Actinoplanes]AEV86268.1 glucuronate isomerase [Actinoplanes sp. SE50/110]ATO84665.1 glucuronate isomerase [Actinoplanes sp. SE50]SLM02075.1 uronate isomerase [Actinoplanes sp. SE50/110]